MEKNLTSIIILTYNNLDYTKACFKSIFEHTSPIKTPYEVIVVDNASTDGTTEYLQGLADAKEIKAIFNKENVGFPKGTNQVVKSAQGEFLCLLNNDTILTKDWLNNMLRILRSDEKIAAVGPYCNFSSGEQMVANCPPYTDNKALEEMAQKFTGPIKDVKFLVFFCCLIKRSVWDELSYYEEI